MRPKPDDVLGGRYALIRRIAVGGMGEVWEATDTLLDRRVAAKILKEEIRTASTFLARFRAEARHAGQLSHSGIATVFDYGETVDLAYLVMELVRGQPLSELIIEQPDMPTRTRLSILAQAADALQAAHAAGVVHRDVKPGNLMVRHDGIVKVTDFGIARALTSAPLTDHGQVVGTPAYVSPEQATGGEVNGASDIYSLAVVAYELFAGRPPFERDTPVGLALAHVNDRPPPLPDTVPRRVAELIESALAKDPSQRPSSATHFAAQLRREMAAIQTAPTPTPTIVSPAPAPAPAPTIVSPASGRPPAGRTSTPLSPAAIGRHVGRHSSVMVAVFAVLFVLVGATILAVSGPGPTTDEVQPDLSVASTIDDPAVSPAMSPATQPPATEPALIQPPATQPASTQPPATEPPVMLPASTLPASTQPPTSPPPLPAAAPPPPASPEGGVGEGEAVAFVVDYYERLRDGEYATTWELLSPQFRDDRNLTFERYVSYWEDTSIELRDLRFVDGPGADESRVRFEARYVTGSGIVNETDEITLRQQPDGRLIITEQRIV